MYSKELTGPFCLPRKQGVQRSTSSSTQEGIIQWFQAEQLPLRAAFEKATDQVAPWFHGEGARKDWPIPPPRSHSLCGGLPVETLPVRALGQVLVLHLTNKNLAF